LGWVWKLWWLSCVWNFDVTSPLHFIGFGARLQKRTSMDCSRKALWKPFLFFVSFHELLHLLFVLGHYWNWTWAWVYLMCPCMEDGNHINNNKSVCSCLDLCFVCAYVLFSCFCVIYIYIYILVWTRCIMHPSIPPPGPSHFPLRF